VEVREQCTGLVREGWCRQVDLKAIGQTVTVQGVLAKDASLYGYLQKITLPDGSALELVNPDDVSNQSSAVKESAA
jgi:hypothetical protein